MKSMSRSTPKGRLLPKGRKNHKDSRPTPAGKVAVHVATAKRFGNHVASAGKTAKSFQKWLLSADNSGKRKEKCVLTGDNSKN